MRNNVQNSDNFVVSVIVPIYNQEKYLKKSVPAILKQTYKNLEVILVNDGSIDGSRRIIDLYAENDSRIKIINKENGGLVSASVSGIRASSGKYVAFLDPDDTIGEDFIQNFVDELDDDYDFVSEGIYYDDNGKIKPFYLEKDQIIDCNDIPWLRTHYLLGDNSSVPSTCLFHSRWNKLYKTACVKKIVDRFEKYANVTLGEDSVFTYLMLCEAKKGKIVRKPNTYYYNIGNQNSMMNNNTIEKHIEKAKYVFTMYRNEMKANDELNDQPYMLYFMLCGSLMSRALKAGENQFVHAYELLHNDNEYIEALNRLMVKEKKWKKKAKLYLIKKIKNPKVYLSIVSNARKLIKSDAYGV